MSKHLFVVRMWCEANEMEGGAPEFRGVVRHALNGDSCPLKDTTSLVLFIGRYLEEMGVKASEIEDSHDPL